MEVDAPETISATGGRFAIEGQRRDARHAGGHLPLPQGRQGSRWSGRQTDRSLYGLEGKHLGILFQGTEATLVADYGTFKIFPEKGRDDRPAAEDHPQLGRPPSRVARRDQVARADLVPLRVRPPALDRRPPRQHRPLDRRDPEVGRQGRAGDEPPRGQPPSLARPTSTRAAVVDPEGLRPPTDDRTLAIPALADRPDDAGRMGRPARQGRGADVVVERESPQRGAGFTSKRCGVRGMRCSPGRTSRRSTSRSRSPIPPECGRFLEEAAAAIGWEIHPDDDG